MKNTRFAFLEERCQATFGGEKGSELFQSTDDIYHELMSNADDRGNEAIRWHITHSIYPVMAYYMALRKAGYEKDQALEYVRKITHEAAEKGKEQNEKLAKMPLTYLMYRLAIKSVMNKNFPAEGWDIEWIRNDVQEIHLDMKRCIYDELTRQHGCPELCCVYCENDDITFAGLMPKIRFKRSGTIGKGFERCDFHFINNKKVR